MGTKYSTVTVSGYNATPPSDDGTVAESNKVKWSTIKEKLPDPLKTAIEAVDSRLQTHFNVGPTALTSNTTIGASHYNQIIQVSGASVTLTLSDAATLGAGWYTRIISTDSSNNTTIGRATGGDTINGSAANFTLTALHGIDVFVNAAANGFFIRSFVTSPATTDTAQTFTATQTIQSTDAGASEGPAQILDRNSASPAASDEIGAVIFRGRDSGGNVTDYAKLKGRILDPTNGSEDGFLNVTALIAGVETAVLTVGPGAQLGSPTGGDKGLGTINAASGLYDNNNRAYSAGNTVPTAGLSNSSVTRPKLEAYTNSFSFTSVANGGQTSTDFTHGLSTNQVDVFITMLTGSAAHNVAACAVSYDGTTAQLTPIVYGVAISSLATITPVTPGTGVVRVYVFNNHTSIQNISGYITVLPRV